MNDISMRDRYRGALVGKHAGDSMGAPVEWQTPEYVAEYFAKIGGYHLHDYLDPWAIRRGKPPNTVSKGQATDDSELEAGFAQSLIAYPEFKPKDAYGRWRSFIHGRKAILSNRAYGQGGTLKAALEPDTYKRSKKKFARGEIPTPPSNGGLMRCTSVSLRYLHDPEKAVIVAGRQSAVTHRNSESIAACAVYTKLMIEVLNGKDVRAAWDELVRSASLFHKDAPVSRVLGLSLTKPDYETEMKGQEGYVVLSLRVAVWAAATATDFADGIVKAISVGGDTDTYAAIAGGILGAKFGIEGIPEDWRKGLLGRDKMIELADGLYDIAHS